MTVLSKKNLRFASFVIALLLITPLGLPGPADAAGASGKKVKSSAHSVGSYPSAPKRRARRRGTAYNFTTWQRDTTHEGYGDYYAGRFQFFGQTPSVGHYRYRHRN